MAHASLHNVGARPPVFYVYPRSRCEFALLLLAPLSTSDGRSREKVSGVLLSYRYLLVTVKSARDLAVNENDGRDRAVTKVKD